MEAAIGANERDGTAAIQQLAERLKAGERSALARALTELERLSPEAPALMAAITPALGHALVVGITGPPGAGKSTLTSAYVERLRAAGKTVGVVAVDPSSPISGGAILGDRLRMSRHSGDPGVFIRSLASGGHLGGLSPAAARMIDVFDAAGRDVVIVETVGAGQNEIDIAEIADIRLVLSAPGLGDDIQAMKSGILDIADILVVNKADRPEAARAYQQLKGAVSLKPEPRAPIVKTSALTGQGLEALADAIETVAARRKESVLERRRRRARRLLAWAAAALVEKRVRTDRSEAMNTLCDALLAAELGPEEAARRILSGA